MAASSVEDILAKRRSSNDFRWATKSWTPYPNFVRGKRKDAKEIIQLVLSSEQVKKCIAEICAREGKSESEVIKHAQSILSEMGHDYHLYAVRWFAVVLSKISKRLYLSIQVNTNKLEQMKQALVSYPVILLPTHRSYVDFLLVSFMFFHYDLPLPIIAAGMDFMGMVGIGEMLRRSGAFFIRRKFGGDLLYWALVSEYVKKCALHGGHPTEMFVEGTRSRSGKSISPKTGLLSAMLEMVWNSDVPDILILPISMSYDRTLEEKLYAHELLGQPKPRESTNGLMKALRWLSSQSYGSIYVNFGDLISVREYFDRARFSAPAENGVFNKTVHTIALQSVLQHQKHLMVPIFPLIATVVLSKVSREDFTLDFRELMNSLYFLRKILSCRHNQVGVPDAGKTFEENVRLILATHASLVTVDRQKNLLVPILQPSITVQYMQFQHYANQLLPLIVPCCLIAALCSTAKAPSINQDKLEQDIISSAEVAGDYVFFRELLQEDFPYNRGTELEEMTWAITTLNDIIDPSDAEKKTESNLLNLLRSALEPYLIAYWGMTKILLDVSSQTKDPCEMKQLGKMCQDFIHHQMKTTSHLPKHYGALSLETLNNATLSSVQSLATDKVKLEDGSCGIVVRDTQQLSSTLSRLEKLLQVDGLPLNTERHSTESNLPIENGTATTCTSTTAGNSRDGRLEPEEHQQQLHLRSKL